MATTRTVKAQTRNPITSKFNDPSLHYVLVETKDQGRYENQVQTYLEIPSLVDPNKDMYHVVTDKREDLGTRNKILLACSIADYDAHMKRVKEESDYRIKKSHSPIQSGDYTLGETEIERVKMEAPKE